MSPERKHCLSVGTVVSSWQLLYGHKNTRNTISILLPFRSRLRIAPASTYNFRRMPRLYELFRWQKIFRLEENKISPVFDLMV